VLLTGFTTVGPILFSRPANSCPWARLHQQAAHSKERRALTKNSPMRRTKYHVHVLKKPGPQLNFLFLTYAVQNLILTVPSWRPNLWPSLTLCHLPAGIITSPPALSHLPLLPAARSRVLAPPLRRRAHRPIPSHSPEGAGETQGERPIPPSPPSPWPIRGVPCVCASAGVTEVARAAQFCGRHPWRSHL
jgi:hypothetical protein